MSLGEVSIERDQEGFNAWSMVLNSVFKYVRRLLSAWRPLEVTIFNRQFTSRTNIHIHSHANVPRAYMILTSSKYLYPNVFGQINFTFLRVIVVQINLLLVKYFDEFLKSYMLDFYTYYNQ